MIDRSLRGERFSFKGIDINKNPPRLRPEGFSLFLDVYGLDTKNTLALNRTALTRKGNQDYSSILKDFFGVYKDYMLAYLSEAKDERLKEIYQAEKFDPYTFWLACSFSDKPKIPKDVLQQISVQTTIFKQNNEGNYVQSPISVLDFINTFTQFHFINLRKIESFIGSIRTDYAAICKILNQASISTLKISGDQILTEKSHSLWARTIQISKSNDRLLLYTVTEQESALLHLGEHERIAFLKGLSNYIPSMSYSGYFRQKSTAKRYAIPAFEGYDVLAVNKIPYGIATPFGPKWHYIIAPFVREEAALQRELSKVSFVERIMSSATFPNLVDYVLGNSIQPEPTVEEIRTAYKRLIEEYYDTMEGSGKDETGKTEVNSAL